MVGPVEVSDVLQLGCHNWGVTTGVSQLGGYNN